MKQSILSQPCPTMSWAQVGALSWDRSDITVSTTDKLHGNASLLSSRYIGCINVFFSYRFGGTGGGRGVGVFLIAIGQDGQNWVILVSPYRGEMQHAKFHPPHSTPKLSKSPHFLLTTYGCNQVIHQPSLNGASVINSMYFSMRSTEMVNWNKTFIFMTLLWHLVFMSALCDYQ